MSLTTSYKSFVKARFVWQDDLAKALGLKNAEALEEAEKKGKGK